MRSNGTWALVVVAMVGLASSGCSFSASSASISDSIAGSSESISDSLSSSSPQDSSPSEQAYREDVRDYTATAARSGRTGADFQTGLAAVAERHGVTNWEADGATFVGIGEGLARAGVDRTAMERWSTELSAEEKTSQPIGRLIEQGYDEGHS